MEDIALVGGSSDKNGTHVGGRYVGSTNDLHNWRSLVSMKTKITMVSLTAKSSPLSRGSHMHSARHSSPEGSRDLLH